MLITTEKHEDFEAALLEWGLAKGASAYTGTIHLYTIGGKTVVVYTSYNSKNNYVYIKTQNLPNVSSQNTYPGFLRVQLNEQVLNSILKEAHKPKEYKIKESVVSNAQMERKLINIESGDIKVLTGIEGLDHAVEIFNDIPLQIKPVTLGSFEETLCKLFMDTLLI
ncbi:hypothetical protein NEAUS05_1673 [Nematocida ausubeli]|nr:hypothetical protein NEAUS05_1673 [Nematocida ausubeli]